MIDARTHDEQKYARPTPAGQSDPLWCVGLGEHLPTPREDTGQLNLFVPPLLGHARRGLDGPSAFLRSLFQLSGVGGWATRKEKENLNEFNLHSLIWTIGILG